MVLGTHPLLALASLSLVGPDRGKLETAGALLDEPVDVVRARTVDVLVPADAEMVIEGEILPGEREDEGPFGEFTGYTAFRSTKHVLHVKAITYRDGALYQSVTGGYTPEHIVGLGIQREGDVYNALRQSVPTIKAVHIPTSGCSIFHAYISLKKTAEGQPLQAITHALGMDHGLKLVVVVDEDVDVLQRARCAVGDVHAAAGRAGCPRPARRHGGHPGPVGHRGRRLRQAGDRRHKAAHRFRRAPGHPSRHPCLRP